MPASTPSLRSKVMREAALFIGLFFCGFVLLPIAIWLVGDALFGDYGGGGYRGFFSALSAKIRAADGVAWFLVLSPYLGVMLMRLMAWGWRQAGKL